MEVLHLPFFPDNQYQELLREQLTDRGVNVRVDDSPHPLRPFAHLLPSADVLHVHWIHPYFLFGSYERLYRLPLSWLFCVVAGAVFVAQVALATRLCDRVVWTVHNECNHERRYAGLDRWVSTRVADLADEIHIWDEITRERVRDTFGVATAKTRIVPHGNFLSLYEDDPDRGSARETLHGDAEFDFHPGGPLYLYFGVIRPYKGVPDLLHAFTDVAPDDAALVVAGNPKYDDLEQEIRSLAADDDRIRLDLGYVPNDRVPTYFAAADLVVLPYRHIFNSGTVLLSMSLGRPLVVPAMGSIPSVVPDGNVVYDNLRAGLRRSVDLSPAERERVGRKNRRIAERDHDWGTVVDRMIASYEGRKTAGCRIDEE